MEWIIIGVNEKNNKKEEKETKKKYLTIHLDLFSYKTNSKLMSIIYDGFHSITKIKRMSAKRAHIIRTFSD